MFRVGDFIENELKEIGLITYIESQGFVVEWEKHRGEEQFHFSDEIDTWKLSMKSFDSECRKKSPICIHHWVQYEGFTESYEFCKLCGIKQQP
jgi:hypothetical protein